MSSAELPPAVRAMAGRGADWAAWVDGLPGVRDLVLAEWELRVDGPPLHGYCSLVVPVRDPAGRPAMLKLAFPDDESEFEHLALRHWAGRGAVTLLRADPRRRALLLERLAPRSLTDVPVLAACRVVGALYRQLHVPAPPQLRPLAGELRRWADGLAALPASAPLPHRLVSQAIALDRDLADDPGPSVLLHTDLHYDNVLDHSEPAPQASLGSELAPQASLDSELAPQASLGSELAPQASLADGRWRVIDPKPLAGDPHYELAPMLWNRWDELAGDVREGVRRRFHTIVDAAGLDPDRARDYTIVRMLHNALWRLSDPPGTRRTTPTAEYLTMCIAIAKAVQG